MKSSYRLDACVVGAGPAGSATAIELARCGLRAVLIDRNRHRHFRSGESLAPRTQLYLEHLNVWNSFLELPKLDFPGVVALWGDANHREHDFLGSVYGTGWHISRCHFDSMLVAQAKQHDVLHCEATAVRRAETNADGEWRITSENRSTNSRRTFEARFIVDATGRTAAIATQVGARRKRLDREIAIGVSFPAGHGIKADLRLVLEAADCGWWYTSLLPLGLRIVVLVTDVDLLPAAADARRRFWLQSLEKTTYVRKFADSIGKAKLCVAVAESSYLDPAAGENWIAVGDAAIAFDPLSGQGISRGLHSGIVAAQAICRAVQAGDSDFTDYQQFSDRLIKDCSAERDRFYIAEQRWPTAQFWRRRHRSLSPSRLQVADIATSRELR